MDRLTARRVCRHLGVFLALMPFIPTSGAARPVVPAVQGVPPPPPPAVQGQPPRDRVPAAQRVGTAAIKGRVVDGVTGNPVSRARVRLMSGPGPRPPVLTDSTGTFELTALPSGAHSLMVEKSTYLAAAIPK